MESLFTEEELAAIESEHAQGLSSGEIVEMFTRQGARFSEATLRKYVQLGLLPRSRRIGSKGKHKGSRGIYPACIIRQVNEIKQMMSLDYTIEDLRQHYAFIGGEIEELRILLHRIIDKLEQSIADESDEPNVLGGMCHQIEDVRGTSEAMVSRLEQMAKRIRAMRQLAREAV
ncbi:MAG: hypothetical protein QNJ97_02890 [Myxococcota bacterium]|nr:hypothetical protein [Myxococcota bacterium]